MKPNGSDWTKLSGKIQVESEDYGRRLKDKLAIQDWSSYTDQIETRPKNGQLDAVGIVAILNDPNSTKGPALLLQKQFRPPVNAVTIEVPAGNA